MRARAAALDALVEAGALALPAPVGELMDRELRALEARDAVEEELRRLKARLGEEQR